MQKLNNLSVFFPVHNEEGNICRLVENAINILPGIAENFEIMIIDDGSRDNTSSVANGLSEKYEKVRIITHPENKGYGAALQSGFKNANYDHIFFTDGDGQFDLKELTKLLSLISECDIAAGFRIKRNDPIHRIINGKAYNILVRLLFGLKVRDIDCAFKLIKKQVIDSIELKSNAAFISAELLIRAKNKGFNIKQTGVHHFPREKGQSSGNDLMVVINSFRELFKLRKEIR